MRLALSAVSEKGERQGMQVENGKGRVGEKGTVEIQKQNSFVEDRK